MALANVQLQRKIKQLINSQLQSGCYPDLDVLRAEVLSWQNLGQPTTRAVSITPGSTSSSAQYNDFFAGVSEDLACLYEQAWELFDGERNSFIVLSNQEDALAAGLAGLTEATSSGLGDQFTSFDNIDLTQTTAHIDLASRQVILDSNMAMESLDLSTATATFNVMSPYATVETLSDVTNILSLAKDKYWLSCVHEPTQSAITAQLTIDLGAVFTCNKIVLKFQGAAPSNTVLSVSPDNGIWTTCVTISPGTWFFPASGIRYLQFVMTKVPDEHKGNDYLVYFGINSFSIYYVGFSESGDLVSRPFVIDQPIINQVDLSIDTQIPPLTNITTYVSFNEGAWMPISGSLSLQGGMAQSVAATTATALPIVNGITLYELAPGAVSESLWQPKLVVGTDKYLKMRTYIASIPNNVPTLNVWQGISPYTRAITYHPKAGMVDTTTYSNVTNPGNTDNLFFYRFYINVSGQQQWVTITCAPGYSYCLYLNGDLIRVAGNRALLNTISGLNEIVLILYNYDLTKQTDAAWSWDWNLTSQVIYANQNSFTLVDYPILLYHTPPMVNNYFALKQVDDAWLPVVNFDPADFGLLPDDFILNYQIPNIALKQMRFKATLSRQAGAGSITPILKSYRLVLS